MIANFPSMPLSLPPSIFSFSSLLECEGMNTSAFTLGKYRTLDHAFGVLTPCLNPRDGQIPWVWTTRLVPSLARHWFRDKHVTTFV